jgi:ubiquinone/menaquinone biosynthesis C-methylase UbiE
MSRETTVAAEFTRQADAMQKAPAFSAVDVLHRIRTAVGPPPIGRVLDVACGPGIVAEALAPLATQLVGIDATQRMVELAAARAREAKLENATFQVGVAEELPFADASFDVVVTRLSLHHFPDVAAVLAQIRRVVRSGGRLVVADVVASPSEEEAVLHNALERLRDPTHVRMLDAAELRDRIACAGFELIEEQDWVQPRRFEEWAQIVADPARTEPVLAVMRALARAGIRAGIALEENDGEVCFEHTWKLVVGRA